MDFVKVHKSCCVPASLFKKQISVFSDPHFPVKYKETQSADKREKRTEEWAKKDATKLNMNFLSSYLFDSDSHPQLK